MMIRAKGFYAMWPRVVWKDGERLGISKMLNHDYARMRNASVCSIFPVISGYYARNLTVEGITIDGNSDENIFIDGCRGGVFFFFNATM